MHGILTQNIQKAEINNNTMKISGRPIEAHDGYGRCRESTDGCPLMGTGFPAGRVVIQRDDNLA